MPQYEAGSDEKCFNIRQGVRGMHQYFLGNDVGLGKNYYWRSVEGVATSIYLYVCLSVCLSVYLSIYLSIYLSKKSRLGRRKCRDTTRRLTVLVKSVIK